MVWGVGTAALAQATTPSYISGTIYEPTTDGNSLQTVEGAYVRWAATTIGTVSDAKGEFKLARPDATTPLVVSLVGYATDTIPPSQVFEQMAISLRNNTQLQGVTITAHQTTSFVSSLETIKTEKISSDELRKAACCNLSESFETNATVEVSYSDAVSGAKEIRMLGLDGVYSAITTENIPNLRGLASTFGLSYIPGSWIDGIQVTKGIGSVTNGYESITGQINIEFKKPQDCERERLHLNLYGNQMGRLEANLNAASMVGKKWSTILLAGAARFADRPDANHDGFADIPQLSTLTVKNKWHYQGKHLEAQLGVQGLLEERTGGQLSFDRQQPRTTANGYGIGIDTRRAEAFGKLGILLPKSYQSVGNILSAIYHEQSMFFGLKTYHGTQQSVYYSSMYQSAVGGNEKQPFKVGISQQYDRYRETYNDTLFQRTENVSGAFAEYTNKTNDRLTVLAGLRADWHNLYGWFITPRLHLRYELSDKTSLRAAAGSGFKTANIFADNVALFASSRQLHINAPLLLPERAWNYGVNLYQKFTLDQREGSLSIDAYRTDFVQQVVVDVFSNPQQMLLYNLQGKSFANSLQAELQYELLRRWSVKAAYKIDDARTTYNGRLLNIPFVSRHKALLNTGYHTPNDRWRIDLTMQWYGRKYLTNSLLPDATTTNDNRLLSPAYTVLLGQVTYALPPHWEWYIGGENLTNFRQHNLIVAADNPFGNNFDATNVWGPVMGAVIYAGMRLTIQ